MFNRLVTYIMKMIPDDDTLNCIMTDYDNLDGYCGDYVERYDIDFMDDISIFLDYNDKGDLVGAFVTWGGDGVATRNGDGSIALTVGDISRNFYGKW